MHARFRNTALSIVAGFLAFATSAPASAAVSLRSFAAEQMRLAEIAYHIGTSSAGLCARPHKATGMVLHDLSEYDLGVRPAVARAFSLQTGVGVIQIVPGSAAQAAGLQIDDEIVAVNDMSVLDPASVTAQQKSGRRIARFTALVEAALQNGPVQLTVRRKSTYLRLALRGKAACGGELSLLDSRETNAWSDGEHLVVTTAMANLARNDDEIAFVIAHEMAHNILERPQRGGGIFGFSLGASSARQSELAADQLAVRLMDDGGYRVQGGVAFLEAARRKFWWAMSLDHPGFGKRLQVVSAAIAQLPPKAPVLPSVKTVESPPIPPTSASVKADARALLVKLNAPADRAATEATGLAVEARFERRRSAQLLAAVSIVKATHCQY